MHRNAGYTKVLSENRKYLPMAFGGPEHIKRLFAGLGHEEGDRDPAISKPGKPLQNGYVERCTWTVRKCRILLHAGFGSITTNNPNMANEGFPPAMKRNLAA